MKNKHLLKLLDLSREEIYEILDLADQSDICLLFLGPAKH